MLHDKWSIPEFEYLADNEWEFTEKVDGTNIRIIIERIEDRLMLSIAGRTDNAQIPPALLRSLNEIFGGSGISVYNGPENRHPLTDEIGSIMVERDIHALTIYGEGYGPKINGGDRYTDTPSFVVFDIKVGNLYLSRSAVYDFCRNVGLDSVPVVYRGNLWSAFTLVRTGYTADFSGNFIDLRRTEGQPGMRSEWGDFEAEGIVGVPAVPLHTREGKRIIIKIKGKDFRPWQN